MKKKLVLMLALLALLCVSLTGVVYAEQNKDKDNKPKKQVVMPSEPTEEEMDEGEELLPPDESQKTKEVAKKQFFKTEAEACEIKPETKFKDFAYSMLGNRYKGYFGKTAKDKVKFKVIGRSVGFNLIGARDSKGITKDNTMRYNDALENVDLKYTANGYMLKEDIILKKPVKENKFTFELDIFALVAVQQGKEIYFINPVKKNLVCYMPAGYMYDSAEKPARSDNVEYKLIRENGKTLLEVTVDPEWLNDPKRVYPIVIDPSIQVSMAKYSSGEKWNKDKITPYGSYFDSIHEEVSDDGSLFVKQTDMVLKGRGGLDLEIARVWNQPQLFRSISPYDNYNIQNYYPVSDFDTAYQGVNQHVSYPVYIQSYESYIINVEYDIYSIQMIDITRPGGLSQDSCFPITSDWAFNFPYITVETRYEDPADYYDSSRPGGTPIKYLVYHMEDGRAIILDRPPNSNPEYDDSKYISSIKNSDGTIDVYRKDGRIYRFENESLAYRLKFIKDMNGNEIKFSYNSNNTIKTITDSVGRVVEFHYNGPYPNYISDFTVTDPATGEVRQVKYEYTTRSIDRLKSVTDPAGRKTIYGYGNEGSGNPKTWLAKDYLLTKIQYPSGGYTAYEYDGPEQIMADAIYNQIGPNTKRKYYYTPKVSKSTRYFDSSNYLKQVKTYSVAPYISPPSTSLVPINPSAPPEYWSYAPNPEDPMFKRQITTTVIEVVTDKGPYIREEIKLHNEFPKAVERTFKNAKTGEILGKYQYTYSKLKQKLSEKYFAPGNTTTTPDYTLNWQYDEWDNVLYEGNALGHETFYAYYLNNPVLFPPATSNYGFTKQLYAYPSFVSPVFNRLAGKVERQSSSNGIVNQETYYKYDTKGNVTEVKQLKGFTSSTPNWIINKFSYDTYGNVITKVDGTGKTKTLIYGDRNAFLTQEKQTAVNEIMINNTLQPNYEVIKSYTYDYWGNVKSEAFGSDTTADKINSTKYDYDKLNRLTKITYPQVTGETTRAFEKAEFLDNDLSKYSTYNSTNSMAIYDANGNKAVSHYDGLGRFVALEKYSNTNGNPSNPTYSTTPDYTERNTYDPYLEKVKETIKTVNGIEYKTTFEYDLLGRQTKITYPVDAGMSQAYASIQYTDTFLSNPDGLSLPVKVTKKTVTDENGNKKYSYSDALGQVRAVKDAYTSFIYDYDEVGNMIKKSTKNYNSENYAYPQSKSYLRDMVWSYEYNRFGKVTKKTEPGNFVFTNEYDDNGELIKETDAKGTVKTYTYGAFGLLEKKYPDNRSDKLYYTLDGNIAKIAGSAVTTTCEYDGRARLTKITKNIGGTDYPISYSYDKASNITRINTPNYITYYPEYKFGLPLKVQGQTNLLSPKVDIATAVYQNNDALKSINYANGVKTDYTYFDGRGFGKRINAYKQVSGTTQTLFDLTYTPDAVGNIRWINDGGVSTEYRYDALNRLTYTSQNATSYDYDLMGNRLMQTKGGVTTYYKYDLAGRMIAAGSTTYQYDANGNMTDKINQGTTQLKLWYGYNNNVQTVTGNFFEAYSTDVDGLRVSKYDNSKTTYYLYLGNNVIYEKETTGNETTYIMLGQQRIAKVTNGVLQYYHNDHLGSLRAVTDASGNVVATNTYEPFGKVLTSTGVNQKFKYTGKEMDNTGLEYCNARYYDPEIGRFVQKDPGEDGDNWWVYCNNNPLKFVDPDGRRPGDAVLEISIIGSILVYSQMQAINFYIKACDAGGKMLAAAGDKIPGIVDGAKNVANTIKDKIGGNSGNSNNPNNWDKAKSVNLPSWKKVAVDMEHIASGHMKGGSRVSELKDLFPENMSKSQVQKAVIEAYKVAGKLSTQGQRVLVKGFSKEFKLNIEMWVNTETKIIETAYPVAK